MALADTIVIECTDFGGTADRTYTRYTPSATRTDYIGTGHTTSARNQLQFYRTFPKRNGDSLGVRKAAIKFTQDIEVDNASGTGSIRMPLIFELSCSIPEGTTAEQLTELRALMAGTVVPATAFTGKILANLEI